MLRGFSFLWVHAEVHDLHISSAHAPIYKVISSPWLTTVIQLSISRSLRILPSSMGAMGPSHCFGIFIVNNRCYKSLLSKGQWDLGLCHATLYLVCAIDSACGKHLACVPGNLILSTFHLHRKGYWVHMVGTWIFVLTFFFLSLASRERDLEMVILK